MCYLSATIDIMFTACVSSCCACRPLLGFEFYIVLMLRLAMLRQRKVYNLVSIDDLNRSDTESLRAIKATSHFEA
jgi:hypothetical protein